MVGCPLSGLEFSSCVEISYSEIHLPPKFFPVCCSCVLVAIDKTMDRMPEETRGLPQTCGEPRHVPFMRKIEFTIESLEHQGVQRAAGRLQLRTLQPLR